MPDNSSKVTLPEMYQVLRDIDALLPDDLDSKAYGMLAERCRKIEVPDEGFEDARHECQKALRAARSDIRKELEVIAKFREYTEKRIADAGNSAVSDFDARMARFQSSKRKEESHLSHLAAQLIANSGGGLAEAVAVPSGPKDWELDTELTGSREVANALTKAAKKAQEYISREVKKADRMGKNDAIALVRRAKKEVCVPVHKLHRDYGAMDFASIDALDSFLADVVRKEADLNASDTQEIYLSLSGLAESSKRGCGCGGGLSEASVSKMNRKKKAMDKKPKSVKKIKVRPAPPSVPLTKGGAALQTMLQGRQKLIKAVEADAEGIKYAEVDVEDAKYLDEGDILKGNIGVFLQLTASPPTVYEDVGGEVEYEVSCGGSGEDNFDRTEEYDSEFADGSITLRFFATLGKNGEPEYRLFDSEYNESSGFRDSSYFDDCISYATGKVLRASDLDGFIDEFMPSEDTILDAFADDLSERNYGEEDCQGSGNYYY